jgi:hypothetical protein
MSNLFLIIVVSTALDLSPFVTRLSRIQELRRVLISPNNKGYGKHVKIYTYGSKMGDKVGYAVVKEEHTIKKRILPQNTVFSAEQSAIIEAIQSETNNRHQRRTPRHKLSERCWIMKN